MGTNGIDELVGQRLAAVSSADAIYELLRSHILDEKIAAGQRLREVEVAQRLGVSRTPLREAFTRLISNRLLERTPSGVIVVDVRSALKGIRAIRIALEGYATRLAVPHLDDDDFAVLEASIDLALTLPEEARTERVRNNNVFHGRIYNACKVPELLAAIDNYAGFFISEANIAALSRAQSREVIQDHVKLLQVIKLRDAEGAEQLMRAHLIRGFNQPVE